MTSLVEFMLPPPRFWPETPAQEQPDGKPSDTLRKRYETLLRLSRCLSSARSEDLVTNIAAALRPVVDFDLFDIVVNPEASGAVNPASVGAAQSLREGQRHGSSEDIHREKSTRATCSSGMSCFSLGEDVKGHCSIPLISRGSALGFLLLGRFDQSGFGQDDIEFLTQVAGQVAMVIDNSLAYGRIAHLTEKL